jgi:riboflavin synthase
MFTGIIRHIGTLQARSQRGSGGRLRVGANAGLLARAERGASIAVMGACLTAIDGGKDFFEADLSAETLAKTTLGALPIGAELNLEPSLLVGSPLDGHLVSGHVDGIGRLLERPDFEGAWLFSAPEALLPMLAPKGSVAIDGVSLTIADLHGSAIAVAIVPETLRATTLKNLRPGSPVNIECDPMGRYVAHIMSQDRAAKRLDEFAKRGWA